MTLTAIGNYPGTNLYPPGIHLVSNNNQSSDNAQEIPPLSVPEPVITKALANQVGLDASKAQVLYQINQNGSAMIETRPKAEQPGDNAASPSQTLDQQQQPQRAQLRPEQVQQAFKEAADTVLQNLQTITEDTDSQQNNGLGSAASSDNSDGSINLETDSPVKVTVASVEAVAVSTGF